MSDQEQWQLDGSAPELYQRYLVPATTAVWASDLVDQVAPRPGERILDLACGTGVVARAATERVGSTGRVAALDINPGMLAFARSLPAAPGAAIEWHEGSVLALPFSDAAFDRVLCQLGLQFFPDRTTALREMRRVLVPDGRLAVSVFGPIEHSPATHALANALDRHVGREASVAKRTEHALADTEALRTLVTGAGFRDVAIHTASKLARFPSPADYVRIQLAATPLASLVAQQDPVRRESLVGALIEDVSAALAPYVRSDGLSVPWEMHTVLATT